MIHIDHGVLLRAARDLLSIDECGCTSHLMREFEEETVAKRMEYFLGEERDPTRHYWMQHLAEDLARLCECSIEQARNAIEEVSMPTKRVVGLRLLARTAVEARRQFARDQKAMRSRRGA